MRFVFFVCLLGFNPAATNKVRHSGSTCHGDVCILNSGLKGNTSSKFSNLKYHFHQPFLEYRFKRIPDRICNKSLPSKIVIQLAVFADHALYAHHYNEQRSINRISLAERARNAEDNLKDFIFTSLHNAQLLLDSDQLRPRIKIVLSQFLIWKDPHSRRDVRKFRKRSLNMAYYMRMFCDYQRRLKARLRATWDHAMLLTGFDLSYMGKDKFSGYGTSGSMCLPDSCAVVEASNFKSAYTIIHELGHALGMKHDGQENKCSPTCCVMGPVVVSGNHKWSACSHKEYRSFLKKLHCSRLTLWCLDDPPQAGLIDFSDNRQLPGQKVPLADQCRRHMGNCYRPFFRNEFNNIRKICREVWCTDGNAFVNASHAALEGTYCGEDDNAWCRGGLCVRAPPHSLIRIDGGWSEWSEILPGKCGFSGCSKCRIRGQLTVQRKLRICDSPTPNNGGKECPGSQYKAAVCTTRKCDGRSVKSYASKICRLTKIRRPTHPRVKNFTGEGLQYLKSNRPCIVWCKLRHSKDIYTFFDQFPDGTPCGTDKFCVAGVCMNLSCNGKEISESLGSNRHHSCIPSSSTRKIHLPSTTASTTASIQTTTTTTVPNLIRPQRVTAIPKETLEIFLRKQPPSRKKVSARVDTDWLNKRRSGYNWTPWTPWSPCSRTCGQGFRKRVRYCKNGRSNQVFRNGAGPCEGRWKKYRICLWSHCL